MVEQKRQTTLVVGSLQHMATFLCRAIQLLVQNVRMTEKELLWPFLLRMKTAKIRTFHIYLLTIHIGITTTTCVFAFDVVGFYFRIGKRRTDANSSLRLLKVTHESLKTDRRNEKKTSNLLLDCCQTKLDLFALFNCRSRSKIKLNSLPTQHKDE